MTAFVSFRRAVCVLHLVIWVVVAADNVTSVVDDGNSTFADTNGTTETTITDKGNSTLIDNNGTAATEPTVVSVTTVSSVPNTNVTAVVCRIDATIDFRADPDNVYECRSGEKCCVQDGVRPSCCVDKNIEEEVWDQVKLWGGVLGAATAVGFFLYCFCRRDNDCCDGNDNCADCVKCRCCCCRNRGRRSRDMEEHRRLTAASPSHSIEIPFDPKSMKPMANEIAKVAAAHSAGSLSVQDLHAEHLSEILEAKKPVGDITI